jgi:hypothetical protein
VKEENKLEQLIRQRLNAHHTAFNEAHWLSARKLIDADRKRKKRKWVFFAWGLAALTSCVAFFLLLPLTPGNRIHDPVPPTTQPAAGGIAENSHPVIHPSLPQTSSYQTENTRVKDHAAATEKSRIEKEAVAMQKTIAQNDAAINRDGKNIPDQTSGAVVAANTNNQPLLQPGKQLSRKTQPVSPIVEAGTNGVATGKNTTAPVPKNKTGQTMPASDAGHTETGQQGPVNAAQPEYVLHINPRYTGILAYNWQPSPGENVNVPPPLRPLKPKNSFITQDVGATYFNAGKNLADPVNLSAGLMYYRGIGAKAGINAGVFYSRIYQNLPARVYRNTSYDFGKNVSFVSVQTKRLDYIEFPLQLYCYPLRHHMVRAGISYLYLLQSADLVNRSGIQTRENGYTDAINKNDVLLSAGYTWVGKSPLIFSITGYYGLYDISDNGVFGSARHDRNTGVKLSIGYTLRQLR